MLLSLSFSLSLSLSLFLSLSLSLSLSPLSLPNKHILGWGFIKKMILLFFTSLLLVLYWWLVGFAFSGMYSYLYKLLNSLLLFKLQVLQMSHPFSSLLQPLCSFPLWVPQPSVPVQTGCFPFRLQSACGHFLSLPSCLRTTIVQGAYSVVCK